METMKKVLIGVGGLLAAGGLALGAKKIVDNRNCDEYIDEEACDVEVESEPVNEEA